MLLKAMRLYGSLWLIPIKPGQVISVGTSSFSHLLRRGSFNELRFAVTIRVKASLDICFNTPKFLRLPILWFLHCRL